MRRLLLIASGGLLLALIAVGLHAARQPHPIELIPSLTGQPEYCLTCHMDLSQISASHPVETFGCVLCHGGERLALDADLAHSTMRGGGNPSDLSVVQQSCGGDACHSGSAADQRDHIQRVLTSVQATYAGAIAILRYTFGAQPDLIARMGIYAIEDNHITTSSGVPELAAFDPSLEPAPLQTFAQNCLFCHLSAQPLAGPEYAHLTGCAACHTPFNGETDTPVHRLTTSIPYTQCNTCHNRGNYDLREMQFQPRTDSPLDRLHDYYQPITQFTRCEWTLDCIDCHTRTEVMGDGDLHSNQKEIQYIQCRTCHGTLTEPPITKKLTDPEDLAFRLAFLNPVIDLELGDTIITTDQGDPLWNIRQLPDGNFELIGKASGQRFTFRQVMGSGCLQQADQQASQYCHACHAVER